MITHWTEGSRVRDTVERHIWSLRSKTNKKWVQKSTIVSDVLRNSLFRYTGRFFLSSERMTDDIYRPRSLSQKERIVRWLTHTTGSRQDTEGTPWPWLTPFVYICAPVRPMSKTPLSESWDCVLRIQKTVGSNLTPFD